jgi:hypothetical protein
VDGRDKPGHDEKENHFQLVRMSPENAGCFFGHTLRRHESAVSKDEATELENASR